MSNARKRLVYKLLVHVYFSVCKITTTTSVQKSVAIATYRDISICGFEQD